MQIQPRNFANRPFSSNSSTFHRDSSFYDSSIKKSRLIANRLTLSLSLREIFIQNDSIRYYSVLFIRGVYLNR